MTKSAKNHTQRTARQCGAHQHKLNCRALLPPPCRTKHSARNPQVTVTRVVHPITSAQINTHTTSRRLKRQARHAHTKSHALGCTYIQDTSKEDELGLSRSQNKVCSHAYNARFQLRRLRMMHRSNFLRISLPKGRSGSINIDHYDNRSEISHCHQHWFRLRGVQSFPYRC